MAAALGDPAQPARPAPPRPSPGLQRPFAPVGAAMRTTLPCAHHSFTIVCTAVVLPQPGPPVTTMSGASEATSIARTWPSLSCTSAAAAAQQGGGGVGKQAQAGGTGHVRRSSPLCAHP